MNISESFQTPHNLQSEQSILGGLLIDGNAIDRIGELVEKDFYSEAHRLIFKLHSGKLWHTRLVGHLATAAVAHDHRPPWVCGPR